MKILYFFLLFCSVFTSSQIITFTDTNLKNKLLEASDANFIAKDSNGSFVAIDTNIDGEIEVAEALLIYELNVSSSGILDLSGLENFVNLTVLEINLNEITNLDATPFTNLIHLNFSNNSLTTVNLNGLTQLQWLIAYNNPFTSVDFSTLSSLQQLDIDFCDNLLGLDVSNLTNLTDLNCSSNDVMTSLNVSGCTSLEDLSLQYGAVQALDLSGLANLESVFAESNEIATVDVTGAVSLSHLNIQFNQLTTLTVHDLPVIQSIAAESNQLTSIDLQNLDLFFTLTLDNNQLTSLDLSNVPNTTIVYAENNQLTELILPENNNIVNIHLAGNQFTEIDLNSCINLNWASLDNNPIVESILIKNGSAESLFNTNISNNPNLQYVCVDDLQFIDAQNWLVSEGYNNVNLNSYCSFVPGGEFFEINGQARFDWDADGCTVTDPIVPFLQYNITDGTNSGVGIADSTGFYYIPVQAGNHTITPTSPNAALFDVSPTSFSANFPTDTSPFVQDVCFAPNSVTNDLAVFLTPITPARPGFDADYQLQVKNMGNQILSGDVNLMFPDTVLTYISSTLPFDASTTNSMTWNFTDLVPFQSFTVDVLFNVNPPTDPDFPVNIDDILTFTATANLITGDANPDDNIFILDQVVVGSFDPNDIVCLEGETIPVEDVGKFVHYRIRFENTGTFPAENIVVKNMIDTQKFDLSSFEIVNGSHEFVTLLDGNKVEFIMEEINLPFDDANNDGFVIYKIKTLPTLEEGDIFSNSAEIYFDYNFPIETNVYDTEVMETLATVESSVSSGIEIYPNPVKDKLQIKSEKEIDGFVIYNSVGKFIQQGKLENSNSINVNQLPKGMYIIQLETNQKTITKKFIKE